MNTSKKYFETEERKLDERTKYRQSKEYRLLDHKYNFIYKKKIGN